ncbi:hypothetical protein THAOC_27804 [Thalassiosira oceanica]|uniref:Uncharacterized protein n=1 Tax=Thalassiosira oceanica TaxID=159749 RepID=K0S1T2_THAOC|nr:hypothetical protein THAOC_27804 [Thalassiosira oceanica]|eukprot:EJK52872.1 hypothetical protein THAOC_27804 [Thalassiosira oceanica]
MPGGTEEAGIGDAQLVHPSLLGPSRHRRGRLGGAQSLPPDALEHGSAAVCTGIVAADSAAPQAFLLVQKRCLQQASRAVLAHPWKAAVAASPRLGLASRKSPRRRNHLSSDVVHQLSVANPSLLGPSRHRRGRLGGAQSLPPDALEHGSAAVCTGIVAADSAAPQAFLLVQKRCLQQASRAVLVRPSKAVVGASPRFGVSPVPSSPGASVIPSSSPLGAGRVVVVSFEGSGSRPPSRYLPPPAATAIETQANSSPASCRLRKYRRGQ